ncbi:hypothetical protein MMC13_002950 [Lambiella insularis]|nr:hypothetical protein [Lambiella insularis]
MPSFRRNHPFYVSPFQKRFASEEAVQAEPEADGATQAQHGENSIASSTNPESSHSTTATQESIQSEAQEEDSAVAAALSSAKSTVSNTAAQAAEAASTSAQSAREYVADLTSAVGAGAAASQAAAGKVGGDSGHTLYVGNLFFDVNEDALKKEMSRFGTVSMVRIIYDGRGLSKGFGYVEFEDPKSAAEAIENMNQQVFEGRRMTVQYTIKRQNPKFAAAGTRNSPSKTLFIGNMSFEMSDKDLNDLFRDIKNVIDVRVAIDRRTGQPRGFAHADFIDVASAEKAQKTLESKEIYGRRLRVDYSTSNADSRGLPRESPRDRA